MNLLLGRFDWMEAILAIDLRLLPPRAFLSVNGEVVEFVNDLFVLF